MKVLVTGATGFVGRALIQGMRATGHDVRGASRSNPGAIDHVTIEDIGPATSWTDALKGVEAVVHAAAHVHRSGVTATDSGTDYYRVNTEGTLNLAKQAAEMGVQRLIFLSTIKVNGEETTLNRPCGADDIPHPIGPYALSKWRAEQGLKDVARETRIETVIIRPPLVYGPEVKANFRFLLAIVARGIPLPFGAVKNLRSLVAIDNLVDLTIACLKHPAAANQTLLVSDGQDLSTPDLIRQLAWAMDRKVRLLPVPPSFLRACALLMGKREVMQRLCASLRVDIEKTRNLLGWEPPIGPNSALAAVAQWYLNDMNRSDPA